MAEGPDSESGDVGFSHRVLDRLTAINILVASLWLYLEDEPVCLKKIEECLMRIEQEIAATATLAKNLQAPGSQSA
jgi:hypothetical protein